MAKSVLKYVQKCLDVLESDQVDTINDTEESLRVAGFLEDVYYELMNREEWKFLDGPASFASAATLSKPTTFTITGTVKHIHQVRYNVADDGADAEFRVLKYLEPLQFLERFSTPGEDRTLVEVGNNLSVYVDKSRQPEYYTSYGEQEIILDAYDSDIDSTAVSSKLNVYASIIPEFSIDDEFVPTIPRHMEPLLQSTLNSVSSLYLNKEVAAPDENRALRQLAQARRGHSKVQRNKYYTRRYGRR